MDKRLETYLQTVESELGEMREARREAELCEMRQHLEAIVARLTEGGLSEEEAVEAAIAQFGAARQVGRELKAVGSPRESVFRVLMAPLCGVACWVALSFVVSPLQMLLSNWVIPHWQYSALSFVISWPAAIAAGAVASLISPRWGGRVLLCLPVAIFLLTAVTMRVNPLGALSNSFILMSLFNGFSGILVGSLWGRQVSQSRTTRQPV